MEDHFLERISNLEETVNNVLEHLSRLSESLEIVDRNAFVTRSGVTALVDTLKETRLLREELLYERWESTMMEQMEEDRHRERFTQMRGRFLALYRGPIQKKSSFKALIEEADFLIYSDRFKESAEVLSKALKLDKENYELAFYLAEFHQSQGLNKEAVHYLNRALQANPDHADSLLVLGLLHYGENQFAQATRLLLRCLEVNPHNPVALLSMGSILTSEEKFDEAKPFLERVNELEPQAKSYYLLGLGAKESGRLKEAIDHLSYATELDPDFEDAVFLLGMAYLERGWTRKAKTCFTHALELNPNKVEYREASHEQESPLDDTEATPRHDGFALEDAKALKMAESLFKKGKLKQALPHYRQLLKKYPTNPVLLSSYAVLTYSLRRYEECLKTAGKILTGEAPDMVRIVAHTMHMESLRVLNRYDEAIEYLDQMLQEFPEGYGRTIAHYGLAMTKADMGQDLKQAEILAKAALESSPPEFRHNALDALGWVYFKQGRYEEALELLKSILGMHESLNHLYHYGMVLLALNLQDEAFKVFERTVKLRSTSARVDDFIFSAIQREMDSVAEPQK